MKRRKTELVDTLTDELERDASTSFTTHLIAGSAAGVAEHLLMFPVDVIKTRIYSGRCGKAGFFRSFCRCACRDRKTLFRGIHVAIIGAVPSHAALFATYELAKRRLIDPSVGASKAQNSLRILVAGLLATVSHDLFANAFGVVKTRIMLKIPLSPWILFRTILRTEGWKAFFHSYPVSLAMNIPFVFGYFAGYELMKMSDFPKKSVTDPVTSTLIRGAVAGGIAGMVSNPFDIIRIGMMRQSRGGFLDVVKGIYNGLGGTRGGVPAFFRGSTARAMYYIPSGMVTWFTYELVKGLLSSREKNQNENLYEL